MHTIRKTARRSAWSSDLNPFGRPARPKPRNRLDEENQLAQANTISDFTPSNAADRLQTPQLAHEHPHHANTFPENNPRSDPDSLATPPPSALDTAVSAPPEKSDPPRLSDITPVTADSDATLMPTRDSEGLNSTSRSVGDEQQTGKPRKRKLRKFFHLKEKNASEDVPNEQDSDGAERKPKGPHNPDITIVSQIRTVLFSWINLLLVFVPVGIALHFTSVDPTVVFVMNFLAIIPLAAMLSYATEELALYVGEVIGGLLNASFGNAVELIVSIIALVQGKVLIVQTSLIGSMLSNLLLVLGMCFFFGGINRVEQHFNEMVAQTATSLLALAIGAVIIPTAYAYFIPGQADDGVTPTSRGTAVLLLITYGCYLLFQLRTHVTIYSEPSKKSEVKTTGPFSKKVVGSAPKSIAQLGALAAGAAGGSVNQENLVHTPEDTEDQPELPQLTRIGALVTLLVSTVLVAVCAEFMVDAIDYLAKSVSEEFIGLILLPIVGNAAEHATSVTVAIKDKMDLAIGVAVGSSLQIALLVLPLMIVLNWWGVGSPADLNLNFLGFEVIVLFIAIILVNYVIQDGKSNWMEGVLLQMTYLIIALAAWFYPNSALNGADLG